MRHLVVSNVYNHLVVSNVCDHLVVSCRVVYSRMTCRVSLGTKVVPVVFLAIANGVASQSSSHRKYVDKSTTGEACSISPPPPGGTQRTVDAINHGTTEDREILNVQKCAVMQFTVGRIEGPSRNFTSLP